MKCVGRSISGGLRGRCAVVGLVGIALAMPLCAVSDAQAEIDYVDFGSRALAASDGTPINVGMHTWQAKLGANYRFDLGASP